jgi:hypothetical protein
MRYCCSLREQQPKRSWLEMGFRPQYGRFITGENVDLDKLAWR